MARGELKKPYNQLERDMMETFYALRNQDDNPDIQGGIRALLRMYEIKRRPIALDTTEILEPPQLCDKCTGEACSFKSAVKLCYTHMREEDDARTRG